MKFQIIAAAALLSAATLLAGCGGDKESASPKSGTPETSKAFAGDRMAIAKGNVKFMATCQACHGADAKGLPSLGRDLTISEFVKAKTDEELLAFIIEGREPEGEFAAMPPRGGNAALSDDDIRNIIAFVRSIEE